MSKTLEELLAIAKNANAENPLPQDFADQIETAHLMSLESRDETIKQLEAGRSEDRARISQYAIQNLELIRQAPATGTPTEKEKEPEKTPLELRLERAANFEKKLQEL